MAGDGLHNLTIASDLHLYGHGLLDPGKEGDAKVMFERIHNPFPHISYNIPKWAAIMPAVNARECGVVCFSVNTVNPNQDIWGSNEPLLPYPAIYDLTPSLQIGRTAGSVPAQPQPNLISISWKLAPPPHIFRTHRHPCSS